MTDSSLIETTLKEIARGYHHGALVWMKTNRPKDWGNMLILEQRINRTALEGNIRGLRGALSEYQTLIFTVGKEFESARERILQG